MFFHVKKYKSCGISGVCTLSSPLFLGLFSFELELVHFVQVLTYFIPTCSISITPNFKTLLYTSIACYCLQAVMDHFEDDGIRFTDELGVYTTFIQAYTFSVKKDMFAQYGYYDRQREIEMPDCMVRGSLADAQSLRTADHLRRQLLG